MYLNKTWMNPCHMNSVKELSDDNLANRNDFCSCIIREIAGVPNYLSENVVIQLN